MVDEGEEEESTTSLTESTSADELPTNGAESDSQKTASIKDSPPEVRLRKSSVEETGIKEESV